MDVELMLEHTAPSPGQPIAVRGLVRLRGRAPEGGRRIPLNLALILDRSGSMGGEKLARAQEAAALLVRRLWPEDAVGVAVYDHQVNTLIAAARGDDHALAESLIRSIRTGGSTNLSGGWLRGRELVQATMSEGGVNRILLLTDGLANQGITDRTALAGLCRSARANGITTTTIGFGADFDEDLLRAMADAGGGGAYYIEHADQAPGIFEEEVEGLLSLSAQGVTLEVTPESGAELVAVRHSYPRTTHGDTLRLDLGDLYATEPRLALIEFRVTPRTPGSEVAVARIRARGYVITEGGGVEERTVDLPIRMRIGDGPLVHPEVRRVASLLDAADARESAVRLQEEGRWEEARHRLLRTAASIHMEFDEDPAMQREVMELNEASEMFHSGALLAADRKYLKQGAYDLGRSREGARDRYRREE